MNILAIDAASSVLSVAVTRGEKIWHTETDAGMKHSELAMNFIDEQMKLADLKPGDLEGILCMGGPGSFTGLRIGFSIAKGLALALGIPFAPVPTLDCIALNCGFDGFDLVIPVIQARKGAFFFAVYRGEERVTPYTDASTEQIPPTITGLVNDEKEKLLLTGPGSLQLYESLERNVRCIFDLAPDRERRGYAVELIGIAKNRKLFDNDCGNFLYTGPEYIRKTDAELNLAESSG